MEKMSTLQVLNLEKLVSKSSKEYDQKMPKNLKSDEFKMNLSQRSTGKTTFKISKNTSSNLNGITQQLEMRKIVENKTKHKTSILSNYLMRNNLSQGGTGSILSEHELIVASSSSALSKADNLPNNKSTDF